MKKKLSSKIPAGLILHILFMLMGILAGIIMQRYVGLGNILRSAGVSYPTRTPFASPSVTPVFEIPKAYQGQMQLFILVGQSNMVGWAPIPEGEPTDARIYVFGKDYRWKIAAHPIEDATNQVDIASDNGIAGFGPAMDFAFASLERHPNVMIGLIPCAKNSSGIIQWQRNLSDQSLYGSCLKRVRAASPMGHIAGILFFQGETDAQDPILYPQPEPQALNWASMFTTFVTDFRNDAHEQNLPVVFAQLGANPLSQDFVNWKIIQEQQSSIDLSMTAMITTTDLPLMDGLHFTTDSYRLIGRRFADAYWDLVE